MPILLSATGLTEEQIRERNADLEYPYSLLLSKLYDGATSYVSVIKKEAKAISSSVFEQSLVNMNQGRGVGGSSSMKGAGVLGNGNRGFVQSSPAVSALKPPKVVLVPKLSHSSPVFNNFNAAATGDPVNNETRKPQQPSEKGLPLVPGGTNNSASPVSAPSGNGNTGFDANVTVLPVNMNNYGSLIFTSSATEWIKDRYNRMMSTFGTHVFGKAGGIRYAAGVAQLLVAKIRSAQNIVRISSIKGFFERIVGSLVNTVAYVEGQQRGSRSAATVSRKETGNNTGFRNRIGGSESAASRKQIEEYTTKKSLSSSIKDLLLQPAGSGSPLGNALSASNSGVIKEAIPPTFGALTRLESNTKQNNTGNSPVLPPKGSAASSISGKDNTGKTSYGLWKKTIQSTIPKFDSLLRLYNFVSSLKPVVCLYTGLSPPLKALYDAIKTAFTKLGALLHTKGSRKSVNVRSWEQGLPVSAVSSAISFIKLRKWLTMALIVPLLSNVFTASIAFSIDKAAPPLALLAKSHTIQRPLDPLGKKEFNKYSKEQELRDSYSQYMGGYRKSLPERREIRKSLERLTSGQALGSTLSNLIRKHVEHIIITDAVREGFAGETRLGANYILLSKQIMAQAKEEGQESIDWLVAYYVTHEALHLAYNSGDEAFIHGKTLKIAQKVQHLSQIDYNVMRFLTDLAKANIRYTSERAIRYMSYGGIFTPLRNLVSPLLVAMKGLAAALDVEDCRVRYTGFNYKKNTEWGDGDYTLYFKVDGQRYIVEDGCGADRVIIKDARPLTIISNVEELIAKSLLTRWMNQNVALGRELLLDMVNKDGKIAPEDVAELANKNEAIKIALIRLKYEFYDLIYLQDESEKLNNMILGVFKGNALIPSRKEENPKPFEEKTAPSGIPSKTDNKSSSAIITNNYTLHRMIVFMGNVYKTDKKMLIPGDSYETSGLSPPKRIANISAQNPAVTYSVFLLSLVVLKFTNKAYPLTQKLFELLVISVAGKQAVIATKDALIALLRGLTSIFGALVAMILKSIKDFTKPFTFSFRGWWGSVTALVVIGAVAALLQGLTSATSPFTTLNKFGTIIEVYKSLGSSSILLLPWLVGNMRDFLGWAGALSLLDVTAPYILSVAGISTANVVYERARLSLLPASPAGRRELTSAGSLVTTTLRNIFSLGQTVLSCLPWLVVDKFFKGLAEAFLLLTQLYQPPVAGNDTAFATEGVSKVAPYLRGLTSIFDTLSALIGGVLCVENIMNWNSLTSLWTALTVVSLARLGLTEVERSQTLLLEILVTSLKLLHPFMPYITEEIYQKLPINNKEKSIMISSWPK